MPRLVNGAIHREGPVECRGPTTWRRGTRSAQRSLPLLKICLLTAQRVGEVSPMPVRLEFAILSLNPGLRQRRAAPDV